MKTMHFEPRTIYHIFNQGNNREPIFFQERNYYYFLGKMRKYLLPYVELLSYCLMPNHFHWLIYTKKKACELGKAVIPARASKMEGISKSKMEGISKIPSIYNQQILCQNIGIMLSSYARAINRQENRSGSLFRLKTKAKNGLDEDIIELDDAQKKWLSQVNNAYGTICFNYIHRNPVKDGLAVQEIDWPYSSAREYAGLVRPGICNRKLAAELFPIQTADHEKR